MSIAILTCPRCSTNLRTTKSFSAGSRFRCPQCGMAFAARPEEAPVGAVSRPRSRRSAQSGAPRGSTAGWLMLLGVVGLGLLMLVGAGVALTIHFLPKKDAAPPIAAAPIKSPPAGDDRNTNDPATTLPTPPDAPPPEPWLPPDKQDQVNAAIKRGVDYLEKVQYPGGPWGSDHQTGLAALPALTLLECGVPADDSHVQKAADFVRHSALDLDTTYELALSILFLDRLGDPKDEPLIRTLAVRLLAGQQPSGGWTYNCPRLSDKDENRILTILQATRPQTSLDLVSVRPGSKGIDDLFVGRPTDPTAPSIGSRLPALTGPTDEEVKQAKQMYSLLPQNLKGMPALNPPTDDRQISQSWDGSDNSNTQFATLGLWAAGRHGVPMERALTRLAQRFQITQTPMGRWNYQFQPHPRDEGEERPAMTGAGLLGLAVGHGVTADLKGTDVEAAGQDPQVEKGMKALAGYVGERPPGLYFLWSVERVGMLYGRRTIDGKEWYPLGVDFLLKEQQREGSWNNGGYPGSAPIPDTCFALLFLKRANLAKDLSNKVQFLSEIKKP